jgi:hypothetical protein
MELKSVTDFAAERITVKEFSQRYDISQAQIHQATMRKRLHYETLPLCKKTYGGPRQIKYIFIDELVDPFVTKTKALRKESSKKVLKYLVLKSGLEVKNNLFGKIMNESGYIAPNY